MPKYNYKYVAILFLIIGLIPFVFALVFLYAKEMTGFWFMVISFSVFALMSKVLVEESKLKITFTNTALCIQHDKKSKKVSYSYDDYLYAYYCKNYKGQMFLILSESNLERKRVKSIVSYGGGVGATFYDSCVVIFIDESNKQIDDIKKHISEKIKNVYEFL